MRPSRSVNVGLTLLLVTTVGGQWQSWQINRRASDVAANVDTLATAVADLSAAQATLSGRVLDCLDEEGECKAKNDAATHAAVSSIVETVNADLSTVLGQLQADLERLRLGQRVTVTPLPPLPAATPSPTTTTTVTPTTTTIPGAPTICLPLGVVTVGCDP